MIWSEVETSCLPMFLVPAWKGKAKSCDTSSDTRKRLIPLVVHRYAISLPSFHLRLFISCYHSRSLAPDLRETRSISSTAPMMFGTHNTCGLSTRQATMLTGLIFLFSFELLLEIL